MKLEGKLADLLTKFEPDIYSKCLHTVNGKSFIHMKLRKVIYGTLQAAMLFWQDLKNTLTDRGFIINPYD